MKQWIFCLCVSWLLSGCWDTPDCAPAPSHMELVPQSLTQLDSASWMLGPYTQGALHVLWFQIKDKPASLMLTNRGKDSLIIDLKDYKAFLPTQDSVSLILQWNVDASILRVLHQDTTCFQTILPFHGDLGVHGIRVLTPATLRPIRLGKAEFVQDPPDITLAYWGNSVGPDGSPVARPWHSQLAEQIYSQGVFLRMWGYNPDVATGKTFPLTEKKYLEQVLSKQPDYLILSGGWFAEHKQGGAGIPDFRQAMFELIEMAKRAGTQPILLIPPSLPAGRSQKEQDLRSKYNMELRTLAVNGAAPVVDLWDRFRSQENRKKNLQTEKEILTQAGHDLVASSLFDLIRYYLDYGNTQ